MASSRGSGGRQGAVRAVSGTLGGASRMEPETDRSETRQRVVYLGCQKWQKEILADSNSCPEHVRITRLNG
jgi:hypothetical protein